MIKNGLEKEVKKLIKKYGWTKVFKNTIGYKEWNNYQNKKEIIDAVKLNTYHYAKRQVTWFSAHPAKRVSGFAHEHSEMGGKQQNKIHWIKNFRQVEQLVEEFLRR